MVKNTPTEPYYLVTFILSMSWYFVIDISCNWQKSAFLLRRNGVLSYKDNPLLGKGNLVTDAFRTTSNISVEMENIKQRLRLRKCFKTG